MNMADPIEITIMMTRHRWKIWLTYYITCPLRS